VVLAASPLDVAVVCDDEDVAIWAEGLGALVIWAPGKGLDVAVAHGVEVLEGEGYSWITVSHADLPYPDRLNRLPEFDGITIVPDRRDDGSNVIKIPSGSGFRFSYGKGSFSRHLEEATRVRRPVSVLRDAQLSIDIDDPEDMSFFDDQTRQWGPEGPH
jgi:2-phospho-L-lactate guanylyltransferase (CobY/MobA/RfbA family)